MKFKKDPSPGKTVSNGRLVGFVTKHKFNGLVAVYSKPQLIQLCEPYGVPHISRLNKRSLAQRLASATPLYCYKQRHINARCSGLASICCCEYRNGCSIRKSLYKVVCSVCRATLPIRYTVYIYANTLYSMKYSN